MQIILLQKTTKNKNKKIRNKDLTRVARHTELNILNIFSPIFSDQITPTSHGQKPQVRSNFFSLVSYIKIMTSKEYNPSNYCSETDYCIQHINIGQLSQDKQPAIAKLIIGTISSQPCQYRLLGQRRYIYIYSQFTLNALCCK